ncbi:nitroreductase family protein [Dactylosporangium matsuzakiense]|uniref:Nitroreductase family protein n=1 Tax=Dactylosporangium matsuzakiense TaxID=53360 RepID=A0A9W6NQM5_9ACTN|nr:hypothetical protein [Dactylosporangium matsuzakiense]UWZ48543.1 hypothetical protein Dmats_20335 [Dactylosporangium matsuzakiense]GLL06370.1 hypothetical protein GCM10017581_081200 [Dactylosporangium matsuzakiense]
MQALTWSDLIDPPCPGHRTSQPLQGAPAAVVHLLEGAVGHPQDAARWRTPSAGGIYPYELFLALEDAPHLLAHVDLHRRVVTTTAEAAEAMAGARRFLYALCGRPWLSMRAYGGRGFLYHLVDLGHALFNAALLTGGDDPEATLGVKRFARAVTAAHPTAQVVCIDRVAAGASPADARGWRHDVVDARDLIPYRTEYEIASTGALNASTRERLRRPVDPSLQVLAKLVEQRRSAKRFHDSAEADGRIGQLLDALPERLAATAAGLGLPAPGLRVLAPDERERRLPTPRQATAAMSQQKYLAHARAYVVFGMERGPYRSIDRAVRRELLSIGAASELIYLEAARSGVAVTGVGGMDPRIWARVTGLATPLYLIALGVETGVVPAPAVPHKLDRMNVVA